MAASSMTDPSAIRRCVVFGLPFVSASDLDRVVTAILADRHPTVDGQVPMVVTPNVDIMVQLDGVARLEQRQRWQQARWVLPDGAPIVWASRLLGSPVEQRLAGSSLFAALWPRAVASKRHVLVVAPNQIVVDRLRVDDPTLRAVVPPVFDVGDDAAVDRVVARCCEELEEELADLVVFGLSNEKQTRLVDCLLAAWPNDDPPLFLCLGASLDMYVGLERRAPDWMQRFGLEWFYRFLQDPRGKFKRYFVDDVRFLGIVWREFRARRRGDTE